MYWTTMLRIVAETPAELLKKTWTLNSNSPLRRFVHSVDNRRKLMINLPIRYLDLARTRHPDILLLSQL
jgi:hypothetical protein